MEARRIVADKVVLQQTNILPRRKLLIVFPVLAISHVVCFIDQTGIGVALPTIGRDLNAEDTISWAGTSALIANTIFQVLYGRMSDLFGMSYTTPWKAKLLIHPAGRKSVLLTALALLTVSDVLCGLSRNATMLYIFRGLAGVANGGVVSLSAMIVSDIVTLKERGKWQGIIGAFVGVGNMSGPFVAAAFAQNNNWRGFFWVLSPVAAACGVLCMIVLPTPKDQPRADMKTVLKRIDYGGIFFGSAALILLLIPIAGGGDYFDWNSPMVISMLVLGGCCLLAFVYVEHSIASLPMMPRGFSPYSKFQLLIMFQQSLSSSPVRYPLCSSRTSFLAWCYTHNPTTSLFSCKTLGVYLRSQPHALCFQLMAYKLYHPSPQANTSHASNAMVK